MQKLPGRVRRSLLTLLFPLLLAPGVALAGQVQKEIDLTRSIVQGQRRGIIAGSLPLTPAEAQAFWPLYDEYAKATSEAGDRTVKLIKEYAKHQDKLSDKRADKLLDEYFAVEKAKLEARLLFREKLRSALPAKKAARFFQIENKMDAMMNTELARGVPLVR